MKIAFIVEAFPVLSQTFVLNQITDLIDRGHEVDIYAQQQISTSQQPQHSDVAKYNLLERTYYQPYKPWNRWHRSLRGLQLLIANFAKDPVLLLRSLNAFKYGKDAASLNMLYSVIPFLGKRPTYDIIQCHFGWFGRSGMWLRNIGALQGKLVTAFHGVDISHNIQGWGSDYYDDLFVAGDLFLPACDRWKQRLIELGCDPAKITTHRMGIDIQRFIFTPRYPGKDGQVRLVTVARLTEKKGIEYSIQAVAKTIAHYSNIEYTIVGAGPLQDQLEALIHDLHLEKVIHLVGAKSQQEIIEILDHSHIFLHPSVTSATGDQEASPVAIQEAMAMGLPILATYHSGIPELVEDKISGFLVAERDANALAEKLTDLIHCPDQWAEMGRAGRAKVEKQHDIDQLGDRLVAIYQHLLQAGACHNLSADLPSQDHPYSPMNS